jgi:hypothetical protein
MSVRTVIIEELSLLFEEDGLARPEFVDDLVLLSTELDSLGFAVLVARLDERLGYDPFSLMDDPVYPQTLGEFVEIYSRYSPDGSESDTAHDD